MKVYREKDKKKQKEKREMDEQTFRFSRNEVISTLAYLEFDIGILKEMVEYVHSNIDKVTVDNYLEFNNQIKDFNNHLSVLSFGRNIKCYKI